MKGHTVMAHGNLKNPAILCSCAGLALEKGKVTDKHNGLSRFLTRMCFIYLQSLWVDEWPYLSGE